MITIALVLKSGGPYSPAYVSRLVKGIQANATIPYRTVCLTDMDLNIPGVESIRLKHNWPGWWSKIELFRPDLLLNNTVYMDLDTMIIGNIDSLLRLAKHNELYALRGFNQRPLPDNLLNFATGVMAGGFASYPEIYESFAMDAEYHMTVDRKGWRQGDQGFITDVIGTDFPAIQDKLTRNYIVGRKITKDGERIPANARVFAWSGEPRLHNLPSGNNTTRLWGKYEQ